MLSLRGAAAAAVVAAVAAGRVAAAAVHDGTAAAVGGMCWNVLLLEHFFLSVLADSQVSGC